MTNQNPLELLSPTELTIYNKIGELGQGITAPQLWAALSPVLAQRTVQNAITRLTQKNAVVRVDGQLFQYDSQEKAQSTNDEQNTAGLPPKLSQNNCVLLKMAGAPGGVTSQALTDALPKASKVAIYNLLSKARLAGWLLVTANDELSRYKVYKLSELGRHILANIDKIPKMGKPKPKRTPTPATKTPKPPAATSAPEPVSINVDRYAHALADNVAQMMNVNAEYRQALVNFRNELARRINEIDALLDKYS